MKKKIINVCIFFFIFTLTISFIYPFYGAESNKEQFQDKTSRSGLGLDSLPYIQHSEKDLKNYNIEHGYNEKNSIFGIYLEEYLSNPYLPRNSNSNDVIVIMLFEEGTSKEKRVEILDSIFSEYELLRNYDIIPGIAMTCSSCDLIEKIELLENVAIIQKLFKSRTYDTPVFEENIAKVSSFNESDYKNWWVRTIYADRLDYDGGGVRVAVIDSGMYNHSDLNIVDNQNFVSGDETYADLNGHGTHVGGIIGSSGDSSSRVYRGVAPGVSLINARAGNSVGGLYDFDIISAIEWCVKPEIEEGAGADIISMSFGGGYPDPYDPITKAIRKAVNAGIICVTAAGNSGPGYFTGGTPASGIRAITVGATDKSDNLASFSSWGPTYSYLGYPDIVAPGVNIISTEAKDSVISKEKRFLGDYFDYPGDADYIPLSGTSMACPIVSGALAILKQAFPKITPETARIALLEGATKLSRDDDDDFIKSGAGLINVSASFDFLKELNETSNINNVVKVFPDSLPIKPHDLLHFPGDNQEFCLTVISGKSNTFNITMPNNINGVALSLDQPNISFSGPGVDFFTLDIEIEKESEPGVRAFQLNLTRYGVLYDSVDISLEIRLPEHRILMESYHGLNDWFPEFSFYQIGFYEAMNDISDMSISIDYDMKYWTPDHDVNTNSSLLTEERLAQYDLIVLQNPILPYNPEEINNIKNYFNNGGNILFLGTRYQDLCTENINYLFSELDLDIQINEENIMDVSWLGIGASVSALSVDTFNSPSIFYNVSDFIWYYGNTFTTLENQSIASLHGKTVAAISNKTSISRGKFVAFGDLNWLFESYTSTEYHQEHEKLLANLMDYLLPENGVSINIGLNSERTSLSQINISVHVKNQTTSTPLNSITLNSSLKVTVENEAYFKNVVMASSTNGTAVNNTYNLPNTTYKPYTIKANLTIGTKSYVKTTKILFYNASETPKINSIGVNKENVTRGSSMRLFANLDKSTYNVSAFLAIYSYSFYNTMKTVNETFSLSYSDGSYSTSFRPSKRGPSGIAVFYILPVNSSSNYTNPFSPRVYFPVLNYNPVLVESNSTFSHDNSGIVTFEDTIQEDGIAIYSVSRGANFTLIVEANNSNPYEDTSAKVRVFVNLIICVVTDEGYLMEIYPKTFEVSEFDYNSTTNKFNCSFTIPLTMDYNTLNRTQSISTETDYVNGYIAILYVTVHDSEGGYDGFFILLDITEEPEPIDLASFLIIIIIIIIIIVVSIIGIAIAVNYRKKHKDLAEKPLQAPPEISQIHPEEKKGLNDSLDIQQGKLSFCPHCGERVDSSEKNCSSCGISLFE